MADLSDLEAAINKLNDNIGRLVEGRDRDRDTDTPEVRERPVGERVDPAETQKEIERLQEKLDAENKILKSRKEGWKILQLKQKIEQKTLQLRYDEMDLSKEEYEVEKKALDNLQKKNRVQKKHNELLFDQSKKIGAMLKMGQHPTFNVENFIKLGKAMKTAFSSAKGFFSMLGGGLLGLLIAFVDAIIEMIFAVDKMESSIKKTTGATQEFAREATHAWDASRKFGVSTEDNTKSFQAAYGTITDYTKKGMKPYREEMLNTLSILTKFGVAQDDSAKAIQHSMKVFGETGEEATKTALEMTSFARDLGVPAGALMSQFNAMAPQLAKLGQAGEKAFKDLARTAKATGMELSKLLQMTDKFDTFEGAAEQAGKLNAALGANAVNAMDLMTETDPVGRFEMIRDAILNTGLTFDDMSYYQRKFYTDALGLGDVSDLAKMMSGDMSDLGDAGMKTTAEYAAMADEARRNQDLQERFKAALMDLIPVMTPLIDKLREMMEQFEQGEGPLYEFIHEDIPAFVEELQKIPLTFEDVVEYAKLALFWFGGIKLFFLIATPLVNAYVLAMRAKTAADMSNGRAQPPLAAGLAATAGQLLAVGGAVLMMGAGLAIAAYGLSFFVASFKDLNPEQIAAAGVALVGLAFGIKWLVKTLATLGPATAKAVPAMYAIGGAVALIGAGIGFAAYGLAEMLSHITPEKAAALILMGAGLAALAYSITTLSFSLAAMAAGALGLWVLSSVFDEIEESAGNIGPVLEPYTMILTSLANIQGKGLNAVASSLRNIKNTLMGMPLGKMEELRALMNAAEAVQLSAAAVGFNVQQPSSFNTRVGGGTTSTTQSESAQYELSVDFLIDGKKFGDKVIQIIGNEVKAAALQN